MQVARSTYHIQSNDIRSKIENTRNEMNELAEQYGMFHQLTVAKSQELDLFLNEYMFPEPEYVN